MFRELRRTAVALAGAAKAGATDGASLPISKARAVMQIAITAVLVPICLWVLFGPSAFGDASRNAAAAFLGAVVTFWLKD